MGFGDKVAFVWRVADKLRGHFKPHEYGSVMLPLLVMRRLDAVLEPTKAAVLAKATELESSGISRVDPILKRVAGQQFYNVSPLTFTALLADDKNVASSLRAYINGFSPGAVEVLEEYRFDDKITRLDKAGILYQVLGDFADLDLHPDTVSNEAMGYIFEELLRKFSEMSNETAGEHYTPREVIRLMVNLLFAEDADALTGPAPVRTVYDPAAGTGGMLTVAEAYLTELNPAARVEVFGQELNPETWAIARSELMIKGADPERMVLGNTLTADGWAGQRFDYALANPPYGVDWKAYADPIKTEAETKGFDGRFGAGLPRVSDGSLLFLQHMLSKMKPVDGPAGDRVDRRWLPDRDRAVRVAAVLRRRRVRGVRDPPLDHRERLAGGHRRPARPDVLQHRHLHLRVDPDQPQDPRPGREVVLVDGRDLGTKMRKSLGDKRKELTPEAIAEITRLFAEALEIAGGPEPDPRVKVMRNEEFGYARLTVERPLRRVWRIDDETLGRHARGRPRRARGPERSRVGHREGCQDRDHQTDPWPRHQDDQRRGEVDRRLRPGRRADHGQEGRRLRARPRPARPGEHPPARRVHRDDRRSAGRRPSVRPPKPTSPPRSTPTSPTPGSTTTRPASATRSPSPASSTSTPHPDPSPRSAPTSTPWKPRSSSG